MSQILFRTYRTTFRCCSTDLALNKSTIYALSSGQGKCGVAVIRVSGPGASVALKQLVKWKSEPRPRYAHLKFIHSPHTKENIDKGLVLWFPGPRSFTGEDVCEFQVHGGPAVVSALLEALSHLPDFRMARPGEFTRRAFHNDKMDLVQAEGFADLIQAETEFQRNQAFLQSQGFLSGVYNEWRKVIRNLLVRFETLFNFDFEQDKEEDSLSRIATETLMVYKDIIKYVNDSKCCERTTAGVDVVIAGEPNVGKSSLYNALCQKSAAIVTPHPGTTRDILDVQMDFSGYPVTLYDTCGINMDPKVHPVEAQGIAGARNAICNAQLLILMIDATKFNGWRKDNKIEPITTYIRQYLDNLQMTELMDPEKYTIREFFKKPCVVVFNKCDQLNESLNQIDFEGAFPISVKRNVGMSNLLKKITTQVKSLCSTPTIEYPIITKVRHRALLETCCQQLQCFIEASTNCPDEGVIQDYAILGNHLLEAIRALNEIIDGKIPSEPVIDVLDDIFVKFCIGK